MRSKAASTSASTLTPAESPLNKSSAGPATDLLGEADEEGDVEDDMEELENYELERAENIRVNAELLKSLGLNGTAPIRPHQSHQVKRKAGVSSEEQRLKKEMKARQAELRRHIEPTRRSGRVAAIQNRPVDVKDDDSDTDSTPRRPQYNPVPKQQAPIILSGPEYETYDDLSPQPIPTRTADGVLQFEGRWRKVFTPNVTPEEMFRGGAFGGSFFRDVYSGVLKAHMDAGDDIASLPFTLPASMIPTHLVRDEPEGSVNRFKVRAGQSLQEWERAGWIWSQDPRGWAQWYTRFWAGRRTPDDERQVKRWMKCAGVTGRFKAALMKKVAMAGGEAALGDEDVGRVVRQTLWQWGYELNVAEWRKVMGTSK